MLTSETHHVTQTETETKGTVKMGLPPLEIGHAAIFGNI